MRLKCHDDPAIERARRSHHRRDFGWMMAVVVDHDNAARFPAHFKPALGAAEPGEAAAI